MRTSGTAEGEGIARIPAVSGVRADGAGDQSEGAATRKNTAEGVEDLKARRWHESKTPVNAAERRFAARSPPRIHIDTQKKSEGLEWTTDGKNAIGHFQGEQVVKQIRKKHPWRYIYGYLLFSYSFLRCDSLRHKISSSFLFSQGGKKRKEEEKYI